MKPCSQIGARLETVESLIGVDHGVLNQILGVDVSMCKSPGRAEESGTVGNRFTFEPLGYCRD
jgi:hypothetical protein